MNLTPNNEDRYKYKMRYKYDEAGNRIRKMMYRSRLGEENWTLYNDEVYIRDAKGNETAMYENSNLQYINILGAGLEGKVRKDDRGNTIYSYYYKDHLGSITAVMDGASGTITQAQDYDAWGDICRTYSTTDTTVNKFTGKERDQETGYDYFGARYYDSRISVWLSPDPLFEKHMQWSPYNYVLRNPVVLIDPDGNDPIYIWFIKYRINSSGVNIPFVGHAGVLLIDNNSGIPTFYHYGRWGDNEKGIVKKIDAEIKDYKINFNDGKANIDDLSKVLKIISEKAGKNSIITGVYFNSDKTSDMKKTADEYLDYTNNPKSNDEYSLESNNCSNFALNIIGIDENLIIPPRVPFITPVQIINYYEKQSKYSIIKYKDKEEQYYYENFDERNSSQNIFIQ